MHTAWGFSALVEVQGRRVLFDVGGDPAAFNANLRTLGVAKSSIDAVVISHEHAAPRGGVFKHMPDALLSALDGMLPAPDLAAEVGLHATPHAAAARIAPGIYTTGRIAGAPAEEALVMETSKGLVVLVSCAHPGIGRVLATVEAQHRGKPVRLVVGGLHLYEAGDREISAAVAALRARHVDTIAPAHCTGAKATAALRRAFGAKCVEAGAGRVFEL